MKKLLFVLFVFVNIHLATGQSLKESFNLARQDTLRGALTPLRTCYDVLYYHLNVKIDPGNQTISGSNQIRFKVITNFSRLQIDLVKKMKIEKIVFNHQPLKFTRDLGAVYIDFPEDLKRGDIHDITVYYSGKPLVAERPPWDGGIVWSKDAHGNPWVAVTVQGTGAYQWWPNKEHQSDEPDSVLISITTPDTLMDVSNGRLRNKKNLNNGWTRWDWFVSNPINNYNVTFNIAKYAHFDDTYISAVDGDTLTLDYYVLPENLEKAKKQFQQVKSMLACFEKRFGKYPFYKDGYKLVEAPHLGMEHQSAVAYGNHYLNGYRGRASSEEGLRFDFIIVHESAHEWWGNSVTSKDIADMWIHESFAAYAEALYVECQYGYQAYLNYQNGKKYGVRNDRPIIGPYGVNREGASDMYNKGSLILHTLRHVIDDDNLWFAILKGIQTKFRHQTVTADDIFNYINKMTGTDYSTFFDQYFKHTTIPKLQVVISKQGSKVSARYRWQADGENFAMPVKVTTAKNNFEFIYPTLKWQSTNLDLIDPEDFKVAEDLFYIDVKLRLVYRRSNEPAAQF